MFRNLRTSSTDGNDVHDEVEKKVNLANTCYYSV